MYFCFVVVTCLVLLCLEVAFVLSGLVLWFCLVFSCVVLSCGCLVIALWLSCLVLSCLVLSCLVLSCLVLTCGCLLFPLTLSCLFSSGLVLACSGLLSFDLLVILVPGFILLCLVWSFLVLSCDRLVLVDLSCLVLPCLFVSRRILFCRCWSSLVSCLVLYSSGLLLPWPSLALHRLYIAFSCVVIVVPCLSLSFLVLLGFVLSRVAVSFLAYVVLPWPCFCFVKLRGYFEQVKIRARQGQDKTTFLWMNNWTSYVAPQKGESRNILETNRVFFLYKYHDTIIHGALLTRGKTGNGYYRCMATRQGIVFVQSLSLCPGICLVLPSCCLGACLCSCIRVVLVMSLFLFLFLPCLVLLLFYLAT